MEQINPPKVVITALERAREAQTQMRHAVRECRKVRAVAIALARKHGLSVREIGRHLKLTGQRIAYLMKQIGIE